MVDFNTFDDTDSPENVNIADGSDPSIKVGISNNNEIKSSDISDNGGIEGTITVGTAAIELKVGGSPLTNRKFVTFFNNSSSIIYWGYTNSVTTSNGTPIFKDQERGWPVGPGTSIWLIAGNAGNNGRITERA